LTVSGGTTVSVVLAKFAPSLYGLDGSGTGIGYFRRQPLSSFDSGVASVFDGLLANQLTLPELVDYPEIVIQDTANPAAPGEVLAAYAVGLGPTDPVVPTGVRITSPAAVTNPVHLMIDGQESEILWAGLFDAGGLHGEIHDVAGLYQVRFRVPVDLTEGHHTVALQIAGQTSNTVILPVGKPAPVIVSVANAASFAYDSWSAPSSIVTLYAANLEGTDDLSAFPAINRQGISILFDGVAAPMLHLIPSQRQINLLVPAETKESGVVKVQLGTALGVSPPYYLNMNAVQPGVFLVADPSQPKRRNAAGQFAGTAWLVMPRTQARTIGIADNCAGLAAGTVCGQPAKPGDWIQVYVDGMGRATPNGDPAGIALPTGTLAPADGRPLYMCVVTPEVTIGGIPAEVGYAGLAPGFAGLYQINARIPPEVEAGDDIPLIVRQNYYSDSASVAIEK
jgi:uncharacterized protein (TIGR03437 family)